MNHDTAPPWRRRVFFPMRAIPLMLLLSACATPRYASLCSTVPQPTAITAACTQQPACKRNCYVTLTVAHATGSGAQTVTSNDTATMTETKSRNVGPLP